ncbi:MAG: polysaccharide deacetylase, partial [Bacteroidota bacterium]|nr:polysaccharide deacetylase [Bacteroidota bacterium]
MVKKCIFSTILIFFVLTGISSLKAEIRNYGKYTAVGEYKGQQVIILRSFLENNIPHFFCVNPHNLETLIIEKDNMRFYETSLDSILKKFAFTPYARLIQDAYNNSSRLQDAGLTHVSSSRCYVITTDLCPSRKPLDYKLYQSIIRDLGKIKPIPICITLSGKWMEKHANDLNWLEQLNKAKIFQITWVNHSYTHPYKKRVPLDEDFLLSKDVNLDYEILATEQKMLESGITPSIFFRFPGLVSDRKVFDKVVSYGIIPIGSNAWLAKGQKLKPGSIVLLHGNCNEPVGVNDFIQFLNE